MAPLPVRLWWFLVLLLPTVVAQGPMDAVLRFPAQQAYAIEGSDVVWNANVVQAQGGDTLQVRFLVRVLGNATHTEAAPYNVTWLLDDTMLASTNGTLAPGQNQVEHALTAVLPSWPDGEYRLQLHLVADPWDTRPGNNDPPATRLVLGSGAAATAVPVAHPWLASFILGAVAAGVLVARVPPVRARLRAVATPMWQRYDDWRLSWPHRDAATRRRTVQIGMAATIAGSYGALAIIAGHLAVLDDPAGPVWLAAVIGGLAGVPSLVRRRRVGWWVAGTTSAWTLLAAVVWQQAAPVVPFLRWPDVSGLWPFIVNGLTVGGMYALIALGYTMVYGVLKFINFAHGDVFVWGGYLAWMVAVQFPVVGLPLALLWAIVATAMLGATIERVAYRPLRGADRLTPLITAIAVSMLLAATAQFLWGTRSHTFTEAGSTYVGSPWQTWLTRRHVWGDVEVQTLDLVIVATAILSLVTLQWIVRWTRLGQAIRAVADDMETARIVGIPVDRVITWTFVLGSAFAAIGGVFWALRFSLRPTLGLLTGIKAFTAAVVGGIGHVPGAFVGGIIIGLAENVGGQFIDSRFQNTIAFLILLVFLIARPQGLWGKEVRRK